MNTGFEKSKGYFETLTDLLRAYPEPKVGDWAIVGDDTQLEPSEESTVSTWTIANCKEDGHWNLTTQTYEHESLDLSEYVKKDDFDLSNYLKIGDVDLSPYLVRSDLDGYLKSTDLDLSEYAKKSDIPDLTAVDAQLNIDSLNPVTNQAVTLALNQKADRQSVIQSLSLKANQSDVDSALLSKASVQSVSQLQDSMNLKADKVLVDTKIDDPYLQSVLENYATKDAVNNVVNNVVNTYVTEITQEVAKEKGYFASVEELVAAYPNPEVGDWANVNENDVWVIYRCATAGRWDRTDQQFIQNVDLNGYVTTQALSNELQQYIQKPDSNPYVRQNDLTNATISLRELLAEMSSNMMQTSNANDTQLKDSIDELAAIVETIRRKYISWFNEEDSSQPGGGSTIVKANNMVTLTTQQYQNLVEIGAVDKDIYYFTYEGEENTWGFGDRFPVILTDGATSNVIGQFPINLT